MIWVMSVIRVIREIRVIRAIRRKKRKKIAPPTKMVKTGARSSPRSGGVLGLLG